MLRLEGLTVAYGGVPALRDLDLEVAQGEVVSLIGPNGAGKTTTLRAIFGLVRPSTGTIEFEGRSLNGSAPESIARLGLGLVPEGRHIFSTLTVAENLRLGLSAQPRGHKADLDGVMDLFPVLTKYYEEPAGRLSGGEQQQLAIARALVAKPRMLLLDEPSLGLAPLVVSQVFDVIERLRADQVTVLLVEQNARRAVRIADRTYVLRTGELVMQGTRVEMAGREDLHEVYLGGAR